MQPLAVDLHLLSELRGPALRLAPGRALMARVVEADGSGRGLLNIAGATIEAELPRHVRAGQQLRLVVRHFGKGRVVLELPQTTAAAAHTPPIQLPRGATLRALPDATDDEAGGRQAGSGQAPTTLALSYETPSLGTLELRFELDPAGLRVAVSASPGQPFELAGAGANSLQAVLEQALARPASVTVSPRREHLDLYA